LPFGPDPGEEPSHPVINGSYYPPRDGQVIPNPYAPYVPPPAGGDRWWVKTLVGLVTAAVIAALGWPLGLLWSAISPRMPVRVESDGLYIVDVYGEQRAAAESWFVILSLAAGILLGVLVWVGLRRFRGAITVAALAVGGGAAGWLMWWVGHNVGRAHAEALSKSSPAGTVLRWPIDLTIKNPGNVEKWHGWPVHVGGVLMYLACAAVATYWIIALCAPDSSLNARRRGGSVDAVEAVPPLVSPVESASEAAG
jgi:hypothetical protein